MFSLIAASTMGQSVRERTSELAGLKTLGFTDIRMLFFFSSRRRHTRWPRGWSSDVCSSDLNELRLLFVHWEPNIRRRSSFHSGQFSNRSEERRVGKEGRSRWSPYH